MIFAKGAVFLSIQLKWLGHSCFRAECGGFAVVLDPFAPGSVPGYRDIHEQADLVLCSHDHGDHNARDCVKLPEGEPKSNPFKITALSSFHDDQGGALRGKNTITLLEAGGVRVAHMGDIGCMPGGLILEKLQGVDAMLLPVGGHYTVGPREAKAIVDAARPRVVIPMHYRSERFGYSVIGPVEDFLALCGKVVYARSNRVEITSGMEPQTLVLDYGEFE